jgi:DNA-directed RNA polymerase subunit RPC12/RpoP
MKCIQCGTDNLLRDRTANSGRCKQCHHRFVFEPTTMGVHKISDGFFAKAIADISANNTLYFTPKQLLYLINYRIDRRLGLRLTGLQVGGFITAGVGMFLLRQVWFILVPIGVGLIILGSTKRFRRRKTIPLRISASQLDSWLYTWAPINGVPEKLLGSPQAAELPATVSPEVSAYSFDRLVVCESDTIAHLLITNNFHFENNCAILSANGYPQSIFETTMQMVRRNPDLKVYILHNCSPQSIEQLHQLRQSPQWFLESDVVIVDIGILPRQILSATRGMFIQTSPESAQAAQQLSADVRQGLSAEEIKWLETGNYVELESFTPQKLIQILNRGMAGSRDLGLDRNDGYILMDDGGSSIYTVDSFG